MEEVECAEKVGHLLEELVLGENSDDVGHSPSKRLKALCCGGQEDLNKIYAFCWRCSYRDARHRVLDESASEVPKTVTALKIQMARKMNEKLFLEFIHWAVSLPQNMNQVRKFCCEECLSM